MMKLNYKKTKNKECYKNVTKMLKTYAKMLALSYEILYNSTHCEMFLKNINRNFVNYKNYTK